MTVRALAIWSVLLVLAVSNGMIRSTVLTPRLGELAAHRFSTALLCSAILIVSWLTVKWMNPGSARIAIQIGGMWVLSTVAFEFLAGHYIFGNSWELLWADYNLAQGRVWVLVPVVSFIGPLSAALGRRIWVPGGPGG